MRRVLLVAALVGGIAQSAIAADTEAARLAAARAYAALPVVQEALDACSGSEGITARMDEEMIKRGIPAADRAKVKSVMITSMADLRAKVADRAVATMAKVYTVPEIETMTAFVKTPQGAATQRKACTYTIAFLKDIQPFQQRIQQDMLSKLRRIAR